MEARDFALPLLAMLFGGLSASLGPGYTARRDSVRRRLSSLKGRWLAVYSLLALAVAGAAGLWFYQRVAGVVGNDELIPSSPLALLLFGAGIGLPFSIPTVVSAWSGARAEAKATRARGTRRATRQERLEYAQTLLQQIRDVSPDRADLTVTLAGDKGRILVFDGPLERAEADRLVAALRTELEERGFQRVEGEREGVKWWSPV